MNYISIKLLLFLLKGRDGQARPDTLRIEALAHCFSLPRLVIPFVGRFVDR